MKRLGLIVVAIASLVLTVPAAAQTPLPDSVIRRIDAVFARYSADGPGCALGVFQNGRVALEIALVLGRLASPALTP